MDKGYLISKIEAARRQLETAIRLFFYERDSISIHTLASAAQEVLNALGGKQGQEPYILGHFLKSVKEGRRKEVADKLREAQNFFKHADKDHDKEIKFDPESTLFVMWDACEMYARLTGEGTDSMKCFDQWFRMKYRETIENKDLKQLLDDIADYDLPKPAFFETCIKALQRNGLVADKLP